MTEEQDEFLVIQAEEITDKYEDKHLHMNATNIQDRIDPQGGDNVSEVLQKQFEPGTEAEQQNWCPNIATYKSPKLFLQHKSTRYVLP